MSVPKNLSAYNDIRVTLDAAIGSDGAIITPPGSATHWRLRANTFRRLLAARDGSTPYDDFEFRLEGQTVVITRRALPQMEDLSGRAITPTEIVDEDLDTAAQALKRKLSFE